MSVKGKPVLLREVDPEVWRRIKARAAMDGETVAVVVNRLLAAYAAKKDGKG